MDTDSAWMQISPGAWHNHATGAGVHQADEPAEHERVCDVR
jgi:hypothetical protein